MQHLSTKHHNLHLLDNAVFADQSGILRVELGRHSKETHAPINSDEVHLGSKGIRKLAMLIKSTIIPRRGINRVIRDNVAAVSHIHNNKFMTLSHNE